MRRITILTGKGKINEETVTAAFIITFTLYLDGGL